ncbi:MAG: hypothetical protein JNM31_08465 [Flavobacteriales bacterium]|nr:hypothetical protein [Flavobacteriales bacterium]
MPSKALDHVHRLIHSMDRAEKRYFKLYTSRHMPGGKNGSQRLFDAIAAMESYDEAALLLRFKHEPFVKRFAITKRRLYETILRSLDAFHAERSVDDRLRRRLHEVELLHRKALYGDARKHLESVRKLAREHERHTVLLEVNEWERRLIERVNYSGAEGDTGDHLTKQAALLHEEMRTIEELWALKSKVFMCIYRSDSPGMTGTNDVLKGVSNSALLHKARKAGSSRARYLHHHIHAAIAFAQGELARSDEHLAANHTLLITRSAHFVDPEQLLFAVLSNRVYIHSRLGDVPGTEQLLKEFDRWPKIWNDPGATDLRSRVFATVTSLRLALLADAGEFEQALQLVPSIREGLERHASAMSPLRRESLYLQLAFIHFGAGHYDQATQWSNRQLNEPDVDEHGETYHLGRLLDLMIQVELAKKDLLPYTLRNLARYLRTRGGPGPIEEVLLSYARATLDRSAQGGHTKALERFGQVLTATSSDTRTVRIITQLKLDDWCAAKRSGEPFAEVVKEHVRRSRNAA